MKKKYIIVCLFLLFFNMKNIYAAEYQFYKSRLIEREKNYNEFKEILCNLDGADCQNIKDKNTETEIGFYLTKNGKLSELSSILENKKCTTDNIACRKYVLENYCISSNESLLKKSNTYNIYTTLMKESGSYNKCSYKLKFNLVEMALNSGDSNVAIETSMTISYNIDKKTNKVIATVKDESLLYDQKQLVFISDSGEYKKSTIVVFKSHKPDESWENFLEAFKNKYNETGSCPKIYNNFNKEDGIYYLTIDENESNNSKYSYESTQEGISGSNKISETTTVNLIGDPINITDCDSLFSDESSKKLLNVLKYLINLVKIAIPILLIGLGIMDFSKAIFSGTEDNMKKAQSKFLKRVIIGVCIFLIPTLLKLVLTVANGIWPSISSDFCGIL